MDVTTFEFVSADMLAIPVQDENAEDDDAAEEDALAEPATTPVKVKVSGRPKASGGTATWVGTAADGGNGTKTYRRVP